MESSRKAKMQAAILQAPRRFTIEQMDIPQPGPNELLVATKSTGICTSELDIWQGKVAGLEYPRFIGHEPAGIVEAVGSGVTDFSVGDRVTVWSEGKAYAEHFVTPAAYAMKLKRETAFEHALGEPIACATNGVRKADPQLNDSVAIVGCGFMGLIMMQVFKARGAGLVIAVDARDSILELASQLGATHTINPTQQDAVATIKKLTDGRGVDIGVEAAGKQATLDLTSNIVRMEGKLEVFGFHAGSLREVSWGYWNWMAFTVVNGHVRSAQIYVDGMKIGIGLLEAGKLDMRPLVTHRFPLQEINHAFEYAAEKKEGFVKGVIAF